MGKRCSQLINIVNLSFFQIKIISFEFLNKSIFYILFFLLSISSFSQVREFGLFAGGTYYTGELNRSHMSQVDYSLGAIFKKDFLNERVSLRFQLMYNSVKGSDAKTGLPDQVKRNLAFRSTVLEFGPVFEIDFFKFKPGQSNPELSSFGTPYFLLGVNYMKMNPKAQYNGEWLELQPLMTEGQDNPYSLNQIVIPFGLGVKVNFSPNTVLSIEYGIRKTFTDYLDDVSGVYANPDELSSLSADLADRTNYGELYQPEGINGTSYGLQRGNPTDKDWYSVFGFMLTYQFINKSTCPSW